MFFTINGIYTYAIVHLIAALVFLALMAYLFGRSAIRRHHAVWLTFAYLVSNFLISKILFDYVKHSPHSLFDHPSVDHLFEGGFWGWQIVFFPLVMLYPFVLGLPRAPFLRAMALALPPVIVLQKVACFASGCCAGQATTLPWAVVFPTPSACEVPGQRVHPLQIYDALLALGVYAVVLLLDRKQAARPFLFPIFVGLYALTRFLTEFLRPSIGLLPSQWLEGGAVILVVIVLTFARRLIERAVDTAPA
jgi:phosphatidylglycerol:prolipoprotein diacylglycerol transferase